MPEHLRALVVILVLATVVFAFAHRPACAISGVRDYTRRRNLWYALTLVAFLSHSFWIYMVIAILLLAYAMRRETNVLAMFFCILFVLPTETIPIPGMGLINYFFELSHLRLLELFILFPAFLGLILRNDTLPFGRTGPDRLLAAYLLLAFALSLRETTITDTMRQGFYLFIDVFLPYFVVSRSLKDMQGFRHALLSFVLATMVVAIIASFENVWHWILYQSILGPLGLSQDYGHGYLTRDGILRAIASTGQPIALGYLTTVGMGLYLFLQRSIKRRFVRWLGMALLVAGLIASVSRGPWVGAVALLVIYFATGKNAVPRLAGLVGAAVLAFSVAYVLPGGERAINLLPFIGKTEQGSIEGRKDLLDVSIKVIERNPWFGSVDYLQTPEMESMRTGLNIIDIVNTYIQVTLESGLIGLSLFVGFFVLTLLGIYRAMRLIRDRNSEERLLGRALVATLSAILLIIFTVSSITIIPIVYWSVAGLCVAYTQMVRRELRRSPQRPERHRSPDARPSRTELPAGH